jgi:NADH dehydrogenase
MATIGRNRAVVDIKKFKTQGFFAWFIWMFVHLISLIGFRNKFIVMFDWIWSYFSYDKSNRLIISRNPQPSPSTTSVTSDIESSDSQELEAKR